MPNSSAKDKPVKTVSSLTKDLGQLNNPLTPKTSPKSINQWIVNQANQGAVQSLREDQSTQPSEYLSYSSSQPYNFKGSQ